MSESSVDPRLVMGRTFLQSIEWLERVDSTNSYALQQAVERTRFPLLIGTDDQTGGRGRGTNRWWGGAGSLACSLVLSPQQFQIPPAAWPRFSLVVGVGIASALQGVAESATVQVKWPNDVYLNGRKVCGVLIESVPQRPELLVIGFGVNVNNSLLHAPEEVSTRAIALQDVMDHPPSLQEVLIRILLNLEESIVRFATAPEEVLLDWRHRCFLTGKQISVHSPHANGETRSGTCLGIDDDGALRLMTPQGLERILAGTVLLDQG